MDSLPSQESSLQLSGSGPDLQREGNLALCQRQDTDGSTECLGWAGTEQPLNNDVNDSGIMQPLSRVESGGAAEAWLHEDQPVLNLNWQFEGGLLRSVGPDGLVTDLCLGPSEGVTALDSNTLKPYELILQDCPEDVHRSSGNSSQRDNNNNTNNNNNNNNSKDKDENVFQHGGVSSRSSRVDAKTAPPTTTTTTMTMTANTTTTTDITSERHMQFLVVGDGRVQSLAPVFNSRHHPGKDLTARKPFCVTITKWDDDKNSKAYLIPCRDENEIPLKGHLEEKIRPQQQLFDVERGSSFEPFVVDWESEDESTLQLAYQIGYNSNEAASSSKSSTVNDRLETFVIRVMSEGDSSKGEDPSLVTEIPVSEGFAGQIESGILSLPISDLQESPGRMQAHLIRSSRGGMDTSWLASTSFVVSSPQNENNLDAFPNNWTWAMITFLAFMTFYALVVNTTNFFCPQKKKKKRDSELTAATFHSIRQGNDDWGVLPMMNVSLPDRIEEEGSLYDSSVESTATHNRDSESMIEGASTATTVGLDNTMSTLNSKESDVDVESSPSDRQ